MKLAARVTALTAEGARLKREHAPIDARAPHRRRLRLVASATRPIRLRVPSSDVVHAAEDLIEARRSASALWGKVAALRKQRTADAPAMLDLSFSCGELHKQLERIIASWSAALSRAGIVPPADEGA